MNPIGVSRLRHLTLPALVFVLASCSRDGGVPSERAREIADYAQATYSEATVEALARLVSFRTVHQEGVENAENPEFRGMSDYLEGVAAELGLDFAGHGNVALDSEYPVVVAEKAWNAINLAFAPVPEAPVAGPNRLIDIGGGAFMSQIPGDAWAIIAEPSADLRSSLRNAATRDADVSYEFVPGNGMLRIEAHGLAAHSSKPEEGLSAITHLAALLGRRDWPDGQAARAVRIINDLVSTGDYAERFGELAATHPFMGPLTLALTTLGRQDELLVAGIKIRSPVGRDPEELERLIREAVDEWKVRTGIEELEVGVFVSPAHYPEGAPHIPVLLDIFEYYSGISDPQPISIGGGTHARLVPNGVNFGPAMPGEVYTGHSEHEFIARERLELNLRMVTAMLVELAGRS